MPGTGVKRKREAAPEAVAQRDDKTVHQGLACAHKGAGPAAEAAGWFKAGVHTCELCALRWCGACFPEEGAKKPAAAGAAWACPTCVVELGHTEPRADAQQHAQRLAMHRVSLSLTAFPVARTPQLSIAQPPSNFITPASSIFNILRLLFPPRALRPLAQLAGWAVRASVLPVKLSEAARTCAQIDRVVARAGVLMAHAALNGLRNGEFKHAIANLQVGHLIFISDFKEAEDVGRSQYETTAQHRDKTLEEQGGTTILYVTEADTADARKVDGWRPRQYCIYTCAADQYHDSAAAIPMMGAVIDVLLGKPGVLLGGGVVPEALKAQVHAGMMYGQHLPCMCVA